MLSKVCMISFVYLLLLQNLHPKPCAMETQVSKLYMSFVFFPYWHGVFLFLFWCVGDEEDRSWQPSLLYSLSTILIRN